jgi:nitroreductase
MDLYDVMRTTASARAFTDEPVPDEVLERILDSARFASSGGNRQGWRVIVVREQATKDVLAECGVKPMQRYIAQVQAGENPWNPLAPLRVSQEEVERTEVPAALIDQFRRAPVLLVVVVDLAVVAAFDQLLDRIAVIPGASIYPFVQNVLLAARSEGYGGTLTTMAATEEPKVKALLGIPEDYALAAVLPIGRPVRQLTRLRRNPLAEFATRERFDGGPLGR